MGEIRWRALRGGFIAVLLGGGQHGRWMRANDGSLTILGSECVCAHHGAGRRLRLSQPTKLARCARRLYDRRNFASFHCSAARALRQTHVLLGDGRAGPGRAHWSVAELRRMGWWCVAVSVTETVLPGWMVCARCAETVFDRCNSLPLIVRFATLRQTHVLLGDGRAGKTGGDWWRRSLFRAPPRQLTSSGFAMSR